jgi:hypothetical protein
MGKIKKAQSGYDLVKKKQTLSKSVSKYKSPDGNYTTKFKRFKRDDPNDLVPSKIVERRTLKGLLSGAKKAEGKLDVSKLKKAQDGKKVRLKEDSRDYITKVKTDAKGNVTSLKSRRTVKGLLTGAPRSKKIMKAGGKIKKK